MDKNELARLIKGLENARSCVTKDGEWKYDRVPSGLVTELLDFLRGLQDTESEKSEKRREYLKDYLRRKYLDEFLAERNMKRESDGGDCEVR